MAVSVYTEEAAVYHEKARTSYILLSQPIEGKEKKELRQIRLRLVCFQGRHRVEGNGSADEFTLIWFAVKLQLSFLVREETVRAQRAESSWEI